MSQTNQVSKKIGINTLISWGATVVIVGLMFKILHWEGGEWMIAIGLATEALLFFMLGFQSMDIVGADEPRVQPAAPGAPKTADLEALLGTTINKSTIERLSKGFEQFSQTVQSVNDIASTGTVTKAMVQEMAGATPQITDLRKNLTELNSVYKTQVAEMSGTGKITQGMMQEVATTTQQMLELRKSLAELSNIYKSQVDAFRKHTI